MLKRPAGARIAVATALAVTAVAGSAVWYLTRPDGPALEPRFAADLISHVTPLIESKMTADWSTRPARMGCAVKPVGTTPADADTIAEVQAVYVWAGCQTLTPEGTATILPIGVHLTPAVTFDIPTDADWGTGQVTSMFPEQFHDLLLQGEHPAGLEAAMKQRVRELS
ncbi:hypothetical protein AB0G04_34635 [Actinoplanes sp. NPDC023801]|uniref:hypothetical protein n=1 Tax=Actinoplanes sp. NPDC023801 TaxID=3154595 RepID=UPI0033DF3646